MTESTELKVSTEITITTIEPGGTMKPGIYWSFDQEDDPAARYDGPYPDEAAAIAAAKKAIQAAYEAAVATVLGVAE